MNRVRVVRKHRGRVGGAAFWLVSVLAELLRSGRARNRAALRSLLTGRVDPAADAVRARPADWLVFAGQDWWYHNRAHSDFQLATRVARSRNVLLVNAMTMRMPLPGRSPGALRRIGRKLASTAKVLRVPVNGLPGYAVLSPVLLPFYGSPFFRRLNAVLVAGQVRIAMRWRGIRHPVVLTTMPTSVDVIDRLGLPTVGFNRSDKHSAFEETNQPVIRSMEDRLLQESSVVFYVSHHLMEEESHLVDGRGHFLDHGVDLRHFVPAEEPEDLAGIAHPRIGFFGGLDDYVVDFDILRTLARTRPDYQIVLVGDATADLSDLAAMENVHLLGFRPYETIPGYGAAFDVALMPWLDNEWIASCNPIKLKEYLALGLPVVTTDFPELAPYRHLVSVASPARFAEAVDEALDAAAQDDGTEVCRRRASVQDASWDRRARELRDVLEAQR